MEVVDERRGVVTPIGRFDLRAAAPAEHDAQQFVVVSAEFDGRHAFTERVRKVPRSYLQRWRATLAITTLETVGRIPRDITGLVRQDALHPERAANVLEVRPHVEDDEHRARI